VTRWIIWAVLVVVWSIALEIRFPEPEQLPGAEVILTYKKIVAKSAHVGVYTLLTVVSAWVAVPARFRWLMMFFLMAHAWGSEMMQEVLNPICFRGGFLSDVGLDVLGIVIGVALSWRWWVRP